MKNLKRFLILFSALCAVYLIFARSGELGDGIKTGIFLSGTVLMPSLFPFMALCCFLIKTELPALLNKYAGKLTGILFGLPGASASAFVLSMVGGYPVGAKMLKSLHDGGQLTRNQAVKASYFCVGAGPAFLILAVGAGMFKSAAAGVILLVSNLTASLVIALILGRFIKCEKEPPNRAEKASRGISDSFVEGVADASASIITICAFTILFSGIIAAVSDFLPPFAAAALEVTTGAAICSKSGNLVFAAAVCGFGGLSVICQVLAAAGKIRPNIIKFLAVRVCHGGLSALTAYVLLQFFPIVKETFSAAAPVLKVTAVSTPFSIALLLLCTTFLAECYLKTPKRLLDFF